MNINDLAKDLVKENNKLFKGINNMALKNSIKMLPDVTCYKGQEMLYINFKKESEVDKLNEFRTCLFFNKTKSNINGFKDKVCMFTFRGYEMSDFESRVKNYNSFLRYSQKKYASKYISNIALRTLYLNLYKPSKNIGICEMQVKDTRNVDFKNSEDKKTA